MRVIIAGSRHLTPYTDEIDTIVTDSGFNVTEVVLGGADGVDASGNEWAHTFGVDRTIMPANWTKDGKAGGPIRNGRMANYADALILIWDGKSLGSATMKRQAEACDLPIHEVVVQP